MDSKEKKVLVVDDDPTHVRLMEKILQENHYEVISTTEAAHGLQMAMSENPGVIILDVMMPIINGYNFCHLLKTHEKYKHIPIIMLTSRDEKEDVEIGKRVGADAYLIKPVNAQELLKTLLKFLEI